MAVSIYQIKRWYKMLTGKSVWHVNQNLGRHFSKHEIMGYYNNMMEKVTKMPELLDSGKLPQLNLAGGRFVYFPVAIFQYGLGAYDLYLQTGEDRYLNKFFRCADWALENLDEEGRWNNFFYVYPEYPYGAMAQGEGVSLLVRAYKTSGKDEYLVAAKRAVDYMLKDVKTGGVTEYSNDDVILLEFTNGKAVMNGWIFAWWGLYDYVLATKDEGKYKEAMDKSLTSLIKYLPKFKNRYWSIYDLEGRIASPFYHNLHVAQMQAMYQLTGQEIFNEYAKRWERQQNNPFCKSLAFIKKSIQKILEK